MYQPNMICPYCQNDSGIPQVLNMVITSPLYCRSCGKKLVEPNPIVWCDSTPGLGLINKDFSQQNFVTQAQKLPYETTME